MQDNNIIQKAIDCINNLDSKIKRLEVECDMYKTFYRAKHDDIKGILFKYKTCLQEIKKIAETEINELTDSAVYGGRYFEILDLINESGG